MRNSKKVNWTRNGRMEFMHLVELADIVGPWKKYRTNRRLGFEFMLN